MARRFSRTELHRLVWSEPIQQLSKTIGVSDVALAKACRRYDIPVPQRGYWQRKKASKHVSLIALPPRGLGMSDSVAIGGGRGGWGEPMSEGELLGALPEPPNFDKPVEEVRRRAQQLIGRATVPRNLDRPHLLIAKLLEEDETRRAEQRKSSFTYSWNAPKFDASRERRRLRILNGLFFALSRARAKPEIRVRNEWEISCRVGERHLWLMLEPLHQSSKAGPTEESAPRLHLAIKTWRENREELRSWDDAYHNRLESKLTEIAVEVLVMGEMRYREACESYYRWRVERKKALEMEIARREAVAEEQERERKKRLEKARIDRLLGEAMSLRQANDIREYVAAVRRIVGSMPSVATEEVVEWTRWALDEADRIDPVLSRQFVRDYRGDGPARE